MKRAVAFVRLSGAGKTRHGETLVYDPHQDIQAEALRGTATHRGRGLARTYHIHAIGDRIRRPQFDALRSNGRPGGFDAVVVEDLGQITHSHPDLLVTLDELTHLGTGVVAPAYDPTLRIVAIHRRSKLRHIPVCSGGRDARAI